MRQIIFDTETTGLSPKEGHRVIEIGAVEVENFVPTGKNFHVYVNPNREVDAGAVKVHGLTNEFLADKPNFEDIADDFIKFIGDAHLIAHNAPFDLGFMNAELSRINYQLIMADMVIDSLTLARKKFPGSPNSLDALCKRFEIDLSAREKHGALLDSELLAEVWLELNGGRQQGLSLDLDAHKKEEAEFKIEKIKDFPKREFNLSEEELATHEKFVDEKVKDAIWKKLKEKFDTVN